MVGEEGGQLPVRGHLGGVRAGVRVRVGVRVKVKVRVRVWVKG